MSFLLSPQSRLLGLIIGTAVLWTIESLLPLYKYEKHRLRRALANIAFTVLLVLTNLLLSFVTACVANFVMDKRIGNSRYDSGADRIFVTVDGREELAEIDPNTDQIVARYPLTGCKGSHGLLIDSEHRLAFAACEDNSKLVVFDLETKKATATLSVGADPDVLAFDPGLHRKAAHSPRRPYNTPLQPADRRCRSRLSGKAVGPEDK